MKKINKEQLEQLIEDIYLITNENDRLRVDTFVNEKDLEEYPHLEELSCHLIYELETYYTNKFLHILECFFKAKKKDLTYKEMVNNIDHPLGDRNLKKILLELKLIYYLTQE